MVKRSIIIMVTYDEINTLPSRKLINEGFVLIRTFLGLPSKYEVTWPLDSLNIIVLQKWKKKRYHSHADFHQAPQDQICPHQTWTDTLLKPLPPRADGYPHRLLSPNTKSLKSHSRNFKTRHKSKRQLWETG